MPYTVTVELSDDEVMYINKRIDKVNVASGEANTHGQLTIEALTKMLLQDVVLAERRPGSWEGTNMLQVLASHGYDA